MGFALSQSAVETPCSRIWFAALQSAEIRGDDRAKQVLAVVQAVPGVKRAEVYEQSNTVFFVYDQAGTERKVARLMEEHGFPVMA